MNRYGKNARLRGTPEVVGPQLHDACKRNSRDLSLIQDLIESCPDATLHYKDSDKRTALHILCSNQSSLAVVQYVASRCGNARSACMQATSKGMLPLHYACRDQAPKEVVRFLVDHYPDATDHATSSGWLPLHLASARKASADVVHVLIQASPASVQQSTQDGRLALHFACANQAPLAVVKLLVRCFRHAIPVQDRNEWTPLHIACAYSHSLDVIKHLAEQWGDGLLCPGKRGRLPIHVACWEGQELDVVQFLHGECPQTLNMRDSTGLLPLHAACQGAADMDVVRYLIVQEPSLTVELGRNAVEIATYISSNGNIRGAPPPPIDLVEWIQTKVLVAQQRSWGSSRSTEQSAPLRRISDNDLHTPFPGFAPAVSSDSFASSDIHVALRAGKGLSGSRTSTHSDRDSARRNSAQLEEDLWSAGKRLHRACEAPQSIRIIRELLHEFPASIEYRTYGGLCPIHTACLNQASIDVIECLTRPHPRSLHQMDEHGNLPIHLACFSSAPLESIKYLVRQWPESLHMQNHKGELPLERARHPFLDNPDPETILFLEAESKRMSSSPFPKSNENPNIYMPPAPVGSPVLLPGPMGVEELSSKLNAIRTAKNTSSRKIATASALSDPSVPIISPPGRPQKKNYMVPQSPAFQLELPVPPGGPADTSRSKFRMNRARSPSPARIDRPASPGGPLRAQPASPGGKSEGRRNQPASPARMALQTAARLFGGGGGKSKNGRNPSPSPNFRLPFIGGRSSRNNSPSRGNGSRANSRNNSPVRSGNSPSSASQTIGSVPIPDLPFHDMMATLPPRPNQSADGNEIGRPARIGGVKTQLESSILKRNVSNGSNDGSILSLPTSARRQAHPTGHSWHSRTSVPSPNTSPTGGFKREGRKPTATPSPTPSPGSGFKREFRKPASGPSPNPSPEGGFKREGRKPTPVHQGNGRTFEAPVVVEAGSLMDRPTRPGVLAVNEPAMRPDSAMYRAAYGSAGPPGTSVQAAPSRSASNSSTRTRSIDGITPAGINKNSTISTFETPAGVDEVRATLDALRQTKKETKKPPAPALDIQDPHQSSSAHSRTQNLQTKELSSFYRDAIEQASRDGDSTPLNLMDAQHDLSSATTGVAALPSKTSSFYQAALSEASTGTVRKIYGKTDDETSGLGQEAVGSIPEDASMVSIGSDDLQMDDRKPAATLKKPPPNSLENPEPSGLKRESVQSSFYRDALAHAQASDSHIPTTVADAKTSSPTGDDGKPLSSFYRAALDATNATAHPDTSAAAAASGLGFEQPDNRLSNPDDL